MISLNIAGEAFTSRWQPRPARTIDQIFRAFTSKTSIALFLPKNFRARATSRSPHHTVCPWRTNNFASSEPVPPTPSTKMRIGPKQYHNNRENGEASRGGCFRPSHSSFPFNAQMYARCDDVWSHSGFKICQAANEKPKGKRAENREGLPEAPERVASGNKTLPYKCKFKTYCGGAPAGNPSATKSGPECIQPSFPSFTRTRNHISSNEQVTRSPFWPQFTIARAANNSNFDPATTATCSA